MAFTKEYEQVEFTFEHEWAEVGYSNQQVFDLQVRDEEHAAFLSITRDQAEELLNLIKGEIDKHDAWQAEQTTNTQEDN